MDEHTFDPKTAKLCRFEVITAAALGKGEGVPRG
jgi:hypothetical protein